MEARPFPLERLHDATLVHLVRCISSRDWRSLSLTCRRLCHLVRFVRSFGLQLRLREVDCVLEVPASRAFKHVWSLRVSVWREDLQQQGCWDRLADALKHSLERWEGIEEVNLQGGCLDVDWGEPHARLAAPLAALQTAPSLRRLKLTFISSHHDLPHLQPLTQVTSLVLESNRVNDDGDPPPLVLSYEPRAPLADLIHLKRLELPEKSCLTGFWGQSDLECPLALPPHLTYLSLERVDCEAGAFWRHIAACKDLQELHLVAESDTGAQDHPSWGLQQLAGSLTGLTRLVLTQPCIGCDNQPAEAALPQLMQLLYGPDHQAAPPAGAAPAAPAMGNEPPGAGVAAADAEQQQPAAAAAAPGQEPAAVAASGQEPAAAAEGQGPPAAEAELQEPAAAAAEGQGPPAVAAPGQEPAAAAAAEGQVPPPVAPLLPAIDGIPAWYAATYLMLPPGLPSFSSLKVLQLPNMGSEPWGLLCGAPHHWEALAGCTALQRLEGLHASQPPPEGVKFPGVTRLEAAVGRAGDTLRVLGPFPALRQLKLDVVLSGSATAEDTQAAAGPLATHTDVKQLTLDFTRFYRDAQSASMPAEGPTPAQLAAGYCSTLWSHLPSLTALEVVWPSTIPLLLQPPSLAPLKRLSRLVLRAEPARGAADNGLLGSMEVLGLLTLLSGQPTLRQIELHLGLTAGPGLTTGGSVSLTAGGGPQGGQEQQLLLPGVDVGEVALQWLAGLLQWKLPRLERLQLGVKVLRLAASRRPRMGMPRPAQPSMQVMPV